jgi:predicted small metal-binding protein
LANVLNPFGILIHCEYLTAFAQQMHEVAPIAASGVEHTHTRRDVSSQNLIENIDINLPELFLNG